jgi:G1/S-specific cyclin PLC1
MSMVHYVARQIVKFIRIPGESTPAAGGLPTPAAFAEHQNPPAPKIIPLEDFIVCLVNGANVQVGTLLATLIYLERLRKKVPVMSQGQPPPFDRIE